MWVAVRANGWHSEASLLQDGGKRCTYLGRTTRYHPWRRDCSTQPPFVLCRRRHPVAHPHSKNLAMRASKPNIRSHDLNEGLARCKDVLWVWWFSEYLKILREQQNMKFKDTQLALAKRRRRDNKSRGKKPRTVETQRCRGVHRRKRWSHQRS